MALITYLIIPVIILEDRTTCDSMERSAELFWKRWREQVAGSLGFGILNLVLLAPARDSRVKKISFHAYIQGCFSIFSYNTLTE